MLGTRLRRTVCRQNIAERDDLVGRHREFGIFVSMRHEIREAGAVVVVDACVFEPLDDLRRMLRRTPGVPPRQIGSAKIDIPAAS